MGNRSAAAAAGEAKDMTAPVVFIVRESATHLVLRFDHATAARIQNAICCARPRGTCHVQLTDGRILVVEVASDAAPAPPEHEPIHA